MSRYLSKFRCFKGGGSLWTQISGWKGRPPPTIFGTRKVESWAIVWWKKIAEKFNRLSRVHQRHRQQTDRQTDRQQTDRQIDGRPIAYSERNVVRSLKIFDGRDGQEGRTTSACQISSKSHESRLRYNNFWFFQDGGRPPSWICNACVGTPHEGQLVVFITVQNLVGIDAVVLIICMFLDFASLAWKRLFTPQNWGFLGRKWGRGGAILTPNELVSNLVKIDEEMRPWECPQTDRHIHTRTHARTYAKRFYYRSHAICYSYGANNFNTICNIY